MFDEETYFDGEDEELELNRRVVIKLEVPYDSDEQDHPSLWDWQDIVGPDTILLDFEEDEGEWS